MSLASLFLAFIITTLIEIYVLISVGSIIGGFSTILLIIITALIGAYLFKQQGISTLDNAKRSIASGIAPTKQIIEGVIILVCGVLLLTPGFVTDSIGFLGLFPYTRKVFVNMLIARNIFVSSSVFGNKAYNSTYKQDYTIRFKRSTSHKPEEITDVEYWKE